MAKKTVNQPGKAAPLRKAASINPEAALALVPKLEAAVFIVLDGSEEVSAEDSCRAQGLLFAINELLTKAVAAQDRGASVLRARALLGMLEDNLDGGAEWDAVYKLIPQIAALLGEPSAIAWLAANAAQEPGSAQPPREAANAVPGADTQAGGASADDEERHRLALRSAWEIDGLAEMVHNQVPDDAEGLPLRAMLRRVRRLTSVQMSALDDSAESADSIKARFEEAHEASHG